MALGLSNYCEESQLSKNCKAVVVVLLLMARDLYLDLLFRCA